MITLAPRHSIVPFFFFLVFWLSVKETISKKLQETVYFKSKDGIQLKFTFNVSDKDIDKRAASFCRSHLIINCKSIFDDAMHILYGRKLNYFTPEYVIEKYKVFASHFNDSTNDLAVTESEASIDGSITSEKKKTSIPSDILQSSRNLYQRKDLSNVSFVILIAHFREDLTWVREIDSNWSYIIASKTVRAKTLYVRKNKGNEVSSYLTYLVKYYDRYPQYTLFLHGHNVAWHQIYNMKFILDNLRITNGYQNINSISLDKSWRERHIPGLKIVWEELFRDELGTMPVEFHDRCCAQFIVHRDRITARSKEMFEETLDYVLNRDGKNRFSRYK